MKTVILCGGKGSRAHPYTERVPKPLLEVGGRPILRHVMEIFALQGWQDFVLAAGYLSEQIASFAEALPTAWRVRVVDTGEETGTAGRIARCKEHLGGRFFVTYGDGLGDVRLARLLARHESCGALATLTTVPLPSPYGTVGTDAEGRVLRFEEKPRLEDHWINAGFFVFEQQALDFWQGEDLEGEVLPALAAKGVLFAYRHRGFWASMDTYKDSQRLSALWQQGRAPWLLPFSEQE